MTGIEGLYITDWDLILTSIYVQSVSEWMIGVRGLHIIELGPDTDWHVQSISE